MAQSQINNIFGFVASTLKPLQLNGSPLRSQS